MKDQILNLLTMNDILNKYGIKQNRFSFHCPFHGEDKHASAKAYKTSFYCFTCNKHGDLIQFVQDYFNLSFKEAMQKINLDFNLGLSSSTKINYESIKKNEHERKIKMKQEYLKNENFKFKCTLLSFYYDIIEHYQKKINFTNWERYTEIISYFQDKIGLLEYDIDNMY